MKSDKSQIKSLQDPRLVSSQQVFDGAILQLYVNKLKLEDGAIVEREILHHQEAVCVLAHEGDKILLVEQFRPAIASNTIEVPAGLVDFTDDGVEDLLAAAQRELEEETGYRAKNWTNLHAFYPSPGFLDEKITLFMARDLEKVENPLEQDEHENVVLHEWTRAQVLEALQTQKIVDLKTLLALYIWLGQGEEAQ